MLGALGSLRFPLCTALVPIPRRRIWVCTPSLQEWDTSVCITPPCVTPCPGEEHGEVSAVVWGSGMRCSGITGMGTAPSCPLQNEEKSFNFASLPVRVGGREVYRRPRIYLRRGGEFQTGADPFAVYIRARSACVLSRGRKMERVGVWGGHTHCS